MSDSFDMNDVDHVTVGAIGEPGQRVFLLQCQSGPQLVSVKMEKQQVGALAKYFATVLQDLAGPGHLPEDLDVREPVDLVWAAGPIGVQYDAELDRIVVLVEEAMFEGDEEGATLRFFATREQAAAVAIHGTTLVEAGRPICPLCGHPIDPSGHPCPKTNGYRAPSA